MKKFVFLCAAIFIFSIGNLSAFSLKFSNDFKDRVALGNEKGIQLAMISVIPAAGGGAVYGYFKGQTVKYGLAGTASGFLAGYVVGFLIPSIYSYPGAFIVLNIEPRKWMAGIIRRI